MARATMKRRPALGMLGVLAGLGLAAVPAACTHWPAPAVPMPVRRIAARCAPRERCVLMPGVYSRADDFVSEGFVADLHRAAPACEVLLADAHLGYFVEGELLRRLREDVVRPTPRGSDRGGTSAARPWLVGTSLGGFAALAYAMRHGDDIAGVLAIAPYLGRRELLRDISAAGGPLAWSRQSSASGTSATPSEPHAALEDELWRWLARPGFGRAAGGPMIFLGYGRDDRFADAQRVLQSLLPPGHADVVEGGHDWPPWRALWQRWLQRGLLMGPTAGCGSTA